MNSLLWMLETEQGKESSALGAEVKNLWNTQIQPLVSTAIWILVAVLGVVFVVKAVMTAMAVMRAADEPQVRQEKLNGFKYLAIGLVVAMIVLSMANVIMGLITRSYSEEFNATGDSTSFLF